MPLFCRPVIIATNCVTIWLGHIFLNSAAHLGAKFWLFLLLLLCCSFLAVGIQSCTCLTNPEPLICNTPWLILCTQYGASCRQRLTDQLVAQWIQWMNYASQQASWLIPICIQLYGLVKRSATDLRLKILDSPSADRLVPNASFTHPHQMTVKPCKYTVA